GFGSGSADAIDIATGRPGGKLVADDAAVGDLFAAQVAIDGGVAIVGAEYDDDNGNASGSAYLFDVATGQQTVKLTPDDGDREARFGYRVAIDGGVALVGAPRDDGNGINSGAAYLFDVATGRQTAKLTAADPVAQDHFGSSVAIDGGVAIVGAPYDGDNGFASGAAYLFDAATGQQLAKLLPSDGSSLDRFGLTVAIDGGLALVSAQGEDAFGSVYLFDVGAGRELAKLAPGEVEAGEGFGSSVALDGGVAIVGAPGDDSDSGAAYLFDVSAFVIPEPTGAALAFAAMLAATGARARIRTRQRSE
ncbi:MAG: FG-GAP repeat protein, partial [Planctomycetota bacterium]